MDAVSVAYAYPETSKQPVHNELIAHLSSFAIDLTTGEAFESPKAVVAEITETNDELTQRLVAAHQAGSLVMLLRDGQNHSKAAFPDELLGVSKVGPYQEGVSYSKLFVAKSAISMFMYAYFKLSPNGKADTFHDAVS